MEAYLKKHTEEVLVAVAIILLAVLLSAFIWGIVFISSNINRVVIFDLNTTAPIGFDFKGAVMLDLKGLLKQ